ncbi:MAG: hypothetical protein ABIO67_00190, partial [Mycobacteriales bacterium]
RLFSSPSLAYADGILPLPVWGAMFLTLAGLMATSLATGNRTLYRFALWLGIVCMSIWGLVFIFAAVRSEGSPGAFLWPTFVAVACYASNRSLLTGER